jgi:hypothetical protein
MGMFDSISIHESLLPSLPELEKRNLNPLKFQTKNLDNSLSEYYIESNGELFVDEVEYDIIENKNLEKTGWNPPFHMEEKSRKKVKYNHTGEIIIYDLFYNDLDEDNSELIWVDLKLTLLEGKLSMPIEIKKCDISKTESQRKKFKRLEFLNNRRNSDPVYLLTRCGCDLISKIISFLNKIRVALNRYDVPEFYEHKKETK